MGLTINSEKTNKLSLIKQEAKQLVFTFNVAVSTATFALKIKDLAGTEKVSKIDTDFDKSDITNKKIKIILETSDLDLGVGFYNLQLRTTWNSVTSVDKTEIIKLEITESLF